MSKRCPDCGFVNDDSRIYCGSCGELLDPNLRLIKKLNDQTANPPKPAAQTPPPKQEPVRAAPASDFDDAPLDKLASKKKSNAALWIVLGIAVVAVGVIILVLSL